MSDELSDIMWRHMSPEETQVQVNLAIWLFPQKDRYMQFFLR